MNGIEPPCRRDCDARGPGCHGESCPYGWAEYEKQKLELDRSRNSATARYDDARTMTAGKAQTIYGNKRRRKRRRKQT